MAKQKEEDNLLQMESILAGIKARKFSPVYILMGEEPYYSDILLEAFLEYTLEPSERDFNQTVAYAQDTTTADIVQITMVVMNTSNTPQRPCFTGSSVLDAACAIGALPSPASFENTPRPTP